MADNDIIANLDEDESKSKNKVVSRKRPLANETPDVLPPKKKVRFTATI